MNNKKIVFKELKEKLDARSLVNEKVHHSAQDIKQGQTRSDVDLLEDDLNDEEHKKILHKGIHLLSIREHSKKEILDKLLKKTENQDAVFEVVDYLVAQSYVCDRRFTECFVRAQKNREQGPIKISKKLQLKGVSSALIQEYVNAAEADWFEHAKQLHDKKYGDQPVSDYNAWSKRARFLQSRGFTMDQIQCSVPQFN